jgi:hypothetical protein
MGNVATTYGKLGRHEEALAIQERVLFYYDLVSPENHLAIGKGHVWKDALHSL